MRDRFDKIDWFIRVYVGTRYSVLFGSGKYGFINNKIRYLIGVKSGITCVIYHNYVEIKVNSYNSIPLEKTVIFHNVIKLIKSVFNKDKNNYYHEIFLQKVSYKLPKSYLKISFCIKYKCYLMIELLILKELILIRQANQKSGIFLTSGIF